MENFKSKNGNLIHLLIATINILCIAVIGLTNLTFGGNYGTNTTFADPSLAPTSVITYLKSPTLITTDGTDLFVYDQHTKIISKIDATTKRTVASTSVQKDIVQLRSLSTTLFALAKNGERSEIFQLQVQDTAINYTKIQTQMPNPTRFDIAKNGSDYYLYLMDGTNAINVETLIANTTETESPQTFASSQYTSEFTSGVSVTNMLVSGSDIFLSYTKTQEMTVTTRTIKLKLSPSGTSGYYYKTETDTTGNTVFYTDETESLSDETQAVRKIKNEIIANSQNSVGSVTLLNNANEIITNATDPNPSLRVKKDIFEAVKSNNAIQYEKIELSSLAFLNDKIYFTDPANQVLFVYGKSDSNPAQYVANVFLANTSPTPSITPATEHKYLEVSTGTASLYTSPFAIVPLFEVSAGTRLVAIADDEPEFAGYYYCLYTKDNTNQYLYLKKDSSVRELPKTTPAYTMGKVIGSNQTPVFRLPSSITDDKNTILENLQTNTEITQIVLQIVKNSKDESFYCVRTPSGNTGYIRYTQMSSANSQIATKKVKCNGRTKRDTTMYLSPSSTLQTTYSDEQIAEFETLDIAKNTRLKLLEEISAGNKFTKAVYQNDDGKQFLGYVKTEDVKADKLTPLQIIGIILVAINIVLLIVIIIFRKSFAKSKTQKVIKDAPKDDPSNKDNNLSQK